LANNTITWEQVNKNFDTINAKNPMLGQAIKKISMFPDDVIYKGTTLDNMIFADATLGQFQIKDNQNLHNYILKTIGSGGSAIANKERLAIMLSIAKSVGLANNPNQQGSQKAQEENNIMQRVLYSVAGAVPSFIAPAVIVDLLTRKQRKNLKPEQLEQESKNVIRDNTANYFPETRSLNAVPNKIVYGDDSVEEVYNGPNELQGEEYNANPRSETYRESSNEF
jgi:hypothetical protein